MLLPRLITAIIGIPLVIITINWGGIPFFILMLGVVFLALREYFHLLSQGGYQSQPVIGIVIGLILFMSLFLNGTQLGPLAENQGTAALLGLVLIPVFAREMMRPNAEKAIERMALTFFGAFFISWALGHLLMLRSTAGAAGQTGKWYTYYLFITIWFLDTGAYAVGKKFGRRHLAEMVSPKKTIEGALGGIVTGMLVSLLFRTIFMRSFFGIGESLVVGLCIALVAQFSDLAESLLKRDVGVKDSANLLPGHGGILDRFDSFLFTAPFLYYYVSIFKG
jgi:phosphatidate cytidylyltransferase